MKGTHNIKIHDGSIMFDFSVKRKYTIIRGDSATGKTTLYSMIAEHDKYEDNDEILEIVIDCDVRCYALTSSEWKTKLPTIKNTIVFMDEDCINTKDWKLFAKMAQETDNYYVIILRYDVPYIPYSITEIYRIRESQKYSGVWRVYNELDCIYSAENKYAVLKEKKDVVITEDSGSGHEMFTKALPNCSVDTARGKSNIIKKLQEHAGEEVAAIVDGAAFGPEIGKALKYISEHNNKAVLYAPESFEYLLLRLRMFRGAQDRIENAEDYCESSQYESIEQYYVDLLRKELSKKGIRYTKSSMPKQLLSDRVVQEFRDNLPDIFK